MTKINKSEQKKVYNPVIYYFFMGKWKLSISICIFLFMYLLFYSIQVRDDWIIKKKKKELL